MKRKVLVLNATIMLGVGSLFSAPAANATNLHDMETKKQNLEEKRSTVQSGINKADQTIDQLQSQQAKLDEQVKALDLAIGDTNQKIREKEEQIEQTKDDIQALEKEIIVLKKRIAKRNELLKERARSFQQSGGDVSYLEVILGSSSFSDFVDRVNAVATIVEADQDILEQHEADMKSLEEKQASVEEKLKSLENMLTELTEMKTKLTGQKREKDKLMAQLKLKEEETEHLKMSLQEEEEILAGQQAAIQKAIELEKDRLEELEAARERAAQEAKDRAAREKRAASRKSNAGGSSTGGGTSSSEDNSPAPAVSSGNFTRPSAGAITSRMGSRWNKFHAGIDIAQSGSVPIVAAADGVVMRSYYSSTYGNCVMISHSIGGQLYTTVYAHMESKSAATGQVVAKGQQIGYMGNTGRSFGQHLHFELHKGPWNVSKSNAVNPLSYINF
ncbi:peptidase M23 [Bacillus sp. M6-12]|uniref:murein hydrolase activator EnvC family protein n=1 Tax=Bacillus sp. M6-12 TaxID=2054166 RepID=UPI000C78D687|nr:peptidoglycan DD-metalloendopeptidase family protein [Bacillus sp. M6-12]PLS17918.1 peptidase M23 [Bacillus sp. M6-12]